MDRAGIVIPTKDTDENTHWGKCASSLDENSNIDRPFKANPSGIAWSNNHYMKSALRRLSSYKPLSPVHVSTIWSTFTAALRNNIYSVIMLIVTPRPWRQTEALVREGVWEGGEGWWSSLIPIEPSCLIVQQNKDTCK